MKKFGIVLLLLLVFLKLEVNAKEGMWVPLFLQQLNEAEMQKMGLNITAEDIFSMNQASLKDAIVIFGGGCTGEVVSDQGLVLTNHHCGYGAIQSHSSIEHDYLTDGFWAMNKSEELKNPGLTVTFLELMREVTSEVLEGVNEEMTEEVRQKLINENTKKIIANEPIVEGNNVIIKPFFSGNRFILFVYDVFKDIRLVGAPPSNIGKFGGDTDNWMWPRHTGDFSVFRIYANKDNRPAAYAADNVPYKPKKHLSISLKGAEKDDFTFIFGYPGTTKEYLPSDEIALITEVENPVRIKLRTLRLNTMKAAQDADPKVRIQYAGKVASIANSWKKWQGENKGIKRLDAIAKKQEQEKAIQAWVEADPDKKAMYGNLIPSFRELYKNISPLRLKYQYYREAGLGVELISFANQFSRLIDLANQEELDKEKFDKMAIGMLARSQAFYKDYVLAIDQRVAADLLAAFANAYPIQELPKALQQIHLKYKGDYKAYADKLMTKSLFANEKRILSILENPTKKSIKKLAKDPAYILAKSLSDYGSKINDEIKDMEYQSEALRRNYMKLQMLYSPDKTFYPDANFTMRIAYGFVDDYKPRDAVKYEYFTTLEGILDKEDPDIYDYVVEDKLKALHQNKDYGQYADKDGTIHVGFTASNHTTGGNSGSPVFNADGQLIGINFDRNWEGTMSDLIYDPDQCRNISLDIRYCLFIIDKFAGAGHLVDEMTLVQ
ncbi:MAG: S46 family peptidase [Bacteroidales bacterium]|nr:S46 family peptidase [Bacteroidales bacterium]